jgi:peptidoglycan/xylan/chitin deacetylase (PgdA/CDA1 family)
MYHRVAPFDSLAIPASGPDLRLITFTPEAFASQMKWLARRGYTAITLDALLDHRAGRAELPRRPVVITFDDGYQDCVNNVVPILRQCGFTASFFLVAGEVGCWARWDLEDFGWDFPLFDWDAARSLAAEGFEIGAHTVTHPHLAEIDLESGRREICESRRIIEDRLDREVPHFAYPYGSFDQDVRSIVANAGFRSVCSVISGLSPADDDPLALHRINVSGRDSLFDFQWRLVGQPTIWERRENGGTRIKRTLMPARGRDS